MGNNSIHIKLDYPEAILIKKNMLLVEQDLLETSRYIKNYNSLRNKEFVLKTKVKRDLGILKNLISSIQANLPIEEAEMTKEKVQKEIRHIEKPVKPKSHEVQKSNVENQINEIRAKLAALKDAYPE